MAERGRAALGRGLTLCANGLVTWQLYLNASKMGNGAQMRPLEDVLAGESGTTVACL